MASFPDSKYDYQLIHQYILAYKSKHDGLTPPIRHFIKWYGESHGLYASTSMMRRILRRICQENGWSYTYRGIETAGEWHNGLPTPR